MASTDKNGGSDSLQARLQRAASRTHRPRGARGETQYCTTRLSDLVASATSKRDSRAIAASVSSSTAR